MSNTEATPVDIRLPTGELATVPSADLDQAVRAGAHVVTQEDRTQATMGDTAGQLAAAGLGLGSAATFGLSNQAMIGAADLFGGKDGAQFAREAFDTTKRVNPHAYMGGELAGMLAPGGAGELYTGLGNAVERGTLGLLSRGAGAGEGILARALAQGARGAAETSLMNVQNAIDESTLGNTDLNAQKLLAAATDKSVLLGGVVGAGLGLGMAGVDELGSKLLSYGRGPASHAALDDVAGVAGAGKAVRREAQATTDVLDEASKRGFTNAQTKEILGEMDTLAANTADKGLVDHAAELYAKAKSGGDPEKAKFLMDTFQRRAGRIAEQDAIIDKLTRDWAKQGNVALKFDDALNEAQFMEKRSQFAKLVDEAKAPAVRDVTNATLQDIRSTIEILDNTATKGGSPVSVNRLSKVLKDATDRIEGKELSAGEMYMELDGLKRAVGKESSFGKPSFQATEAQKEFDAVYERMRKTLESEDLFGKAGAAQRDLNATYSSAKAKADAFHNMYSTTYGEVAGRPQRTMDPAKVKGVLNQVGGAEADLKMLAHDDFVAGMRSRAAVAREHLDLSPAQQKAIDDGLKALDAMEATVKTTKAEAEIVARTKQAMAEETGRGMGGVVGFFTDAVTRPITTLDRLAAIQRTLNKFDGVIENAVSNAVRGERKAVAAEVVSLAGKAKDRVVDEIKTVTALARNPDVITARAKNLIGDVIDAAPQTAAAVTATSVRMVQYLAMVAPVGVASMDLAGREKVRYSDEELARYARISAALKQPREVVEQASRGRMSRDQVQAIQFVYPDMYAQMRGIVQAQVNELARNGTLDTMPYEQKVQIQTMLGITSDPSTAPDFVRMMQASKQGQAPQQQSAPQQQRQGQSLSTMKAATTTTQTESDRLEAGGIK